MSGGVTQLVAIGAQDAHLVGNPEVSFFRSSYKRYTNFTQVVDRQVIQGNPSANGMSSVRFERKGDMLGYIYLTKKDAAGAHTTFGSTDIAKVEFLIGGQVIDTQDYTFSQSIADPLLTSTTSRTNLTSAAFYPLHFWFCENQYSYLPLVALQYHDVELRITWGSGVSTNRYEVWSSFVLLDTAERQQLSSGQPIDMLITQTQQVSVSGAPKIQELNFNHPIKFLASAVNLVGSPTTSTVLLQLNGVDIGVPRTYTPHFNIVPLYYHTSQLATDTYSGANFLYPFCLDTNRYQPTGSVNFSRLDSARLVTNDTAGFVNCTIYAVNHNVLRIANGMGGVMYAN